MKTKSPSIIILSAFVFLVFPLQCIAVDLNSKVSRTILPKTKVHRLTDKIIDKELELLRLSTLFRIGTDHQTKSRTIREFVYNFLASGTSLGSSTTIMASRWSERPPSSGPLVAGSIGLLIGQVIVSGGIIVEYLIDKYKDRIERKKGLEPKIVSKKVELLKTELEQLLNERQLAIEKESIIGPSKKRVLQLESRVLQDVKELALLEYARFYSQQAKRKTSRHVSYINGLLATSAGGYGGSLVGLLAAAQGNGKLDLPSGIGFITSSLIVMASPVLNRILSKKKNEKAMKEIVLMLGGLQDNSIEALQADLNDLSIKLKSLSKEDHMQHIEDRLAVYAAELDMFAHQATRDRANDENLDDQFKERLITTSLISSSKLTWGTMLLIGGASQANNQRKLNNTIAQAATVYTVGQSVWLGDTLLSRGKSKSLKFTVGGQTTLPVEKLEKRVERLNTVAELVTHTKD